MVLLSVVVKSQEWGDTQHLDQFPDPLQPVVLQ